VTIKPADYFTAYLGAAREELTRHNLSFDPVTGTVYESGSWIERPVLSQPWRPQDVEYFSRPENIWADVFERHIRARAARLANRAKA
jgi:hypothetical protein